MPAYGGAFIFGRVFGMTTDPQPRPAQENTFPGVSGVESLDEGDRGQTTYVTGMLYTGTSGVPTDLLSLKTTFMSYKDNLARPLVDNYGVTWTNVILKTFRQTSKRVFLDTSKYGYFILYEAEFTHLTAT